MHREGIYGPLKSRWRILSGPFPNIVHLHEQVRCQEIGMFSLSSSRQESPKTRRRIDDGLTHDPIPSHPIPSHPILFHLPWDVNLHCYFWSSLVCSAASADHILSILYIDNPCSFSAVSLSLGGIPLCLMHGQCAWALHTHAPCAREKRKETRNKEPGRFRPLPTWPRRAAIHFSFYDDYF